MSLTSRQALIINIMIGFLIVAITTLLMLTMRDVADRLSVSAVPIVIAESTIIATNPVVCPGDVLHWPLTITYNKAPLLMSITRNIRNLDTGALVVSYANHLSIPQEEVGTFERDALWRVPELPPANYRLITTTTSVVGSELLQYYVEFTVRGGC